MTRPGGRAYGCNSTADVMLVPRRPRYRLDPGDYEDDYEDEPATPPGDLIVYPDEYDPEPVLYLPDGTELVQWKPPFGFNRT